MAFRTYSATSDVSFAADSTSHTFTLPDCDIGDLIVALIVNTTSGTLGFPTNLVDNGWFWIDDDFNGTDYRGHIYTHYCDGSEGDQDLTVNFNVACRAIALFIKIDDFDKSPLANSDGFEFAAISL